mmetsp:Transcript_1093/g.3454  ORF Transcript_1093/g.3454 Transcript_1093/m.3454 type:complete len:401 (+) Transcript_1093:880-2082(+)
MARVCSGSAQRCLANTSTSGPRCAAATGRRARSARSRWPTRQRTPTSPSTCSPASTPCTRSGCCPGRRRPPRWTGARRSSIARASVAAAASRAQRLPRRHHRRKQSPPRRPPAWRRARRAPLLLLARRTCRSPYTSLVWLLVRPSSVRPRRSRRGACQSSPSQSLSRESRWSPSLRAGASSTRSGWRGRGRLPSPRAARSAGRCASPLPQNASQCLASGQAPCRRSRIASPSRSSSTQNARRARCRCWRAGATSAHSSASRRPLSHRCPPRPSPRSPRPRLRSLRASPTAQRKPRCPSALASPARRRRRWRPPSHRRESRGRAGRSSRASLPRRRSACGSPCCSSAACAMRPGGKRLGWRRAGETARRAARCPPARRVCREGGTAAAPRWRSSLGSSSTR